MRTLTNPPLTDDLVDDLVALWVEVTNAGGAVGFVGPVTTDEVATAVAGFWDRVIDGVTDLVVVEDGGQVVGFGFLTPAADRDVAAHRGELQKVMRHPLAGGRGIGAAVMAGLEAAARDRGLHLLTLTVRDGTGYEGFYGGLGYRQVATLPGWLRISGRPTNELVMIKDLDDGTTPMTDPATSPAPAPADPAPSAPGRVRMAVRRLDPDLPLPRYARPGDAGMDLMAREDRVLPPGMRCLMPTGVAVAIPEGHVGLVHPRSGLAVREGLSIINTPGTIDAGYRGELMVPLINHDPSSSVRITRGERIAQLVVQPFSTAELVEVDELPDGVRGDGGFGSTGR